MRTNEKATTLQEFEDINVRVDYFWVDKEGKLINWNDQVDLPVGWLHANVRMDLQEFTETFESSGEAKDFKIMKLYINDSFIGELLGADIKEAEHGEVLKCAVAVGYN
jgi:hypothetical protein